MGRKQDVADGRDLNQKLMILKYVSNCRGAVKKLMLLKRITDGGLGAGHPAAGGYGYGLGNCLKIFVIF